MEEGRFLRPKEVIRILGIPRSTLYDLLAKGDIPSTQIGHVILIPKSWVDERTDDCEWMKENIHSRYNP